VNRHIPFQLILLGDIPLDFVFIGNRLLAEIGDGGLPSPLQPLNFGRIPSDDLVQVLRASIQKMAFVIAWLRIFMTGNAEFPVFAPLPPDLPPVPK
jgi:hypothetical protein